jgi:hypothetical protein
MMRFFRSVKAAFHAFVSVKNYERIQLARHALYVQVPRLKPTLVWTLGDAIWSMELSFTEAKTIFQSSKAACDRLNIETIEVGDLSWTTDARVRPNCPGYAIIKFKGPSGSASVETMREEIVAASAEFAQKFDLTYPISDRNSDG